MKTKKRSITVAAARAIAAKIPRSSVIPNRSMLNINSPRLVARGPATICTVIVVGPGSNGSLVLNDAVSLARAKPGNAIAIFPTTRLRPGGTVLELYQNVQMGIVISRLPRGARFVMSYFVDEKPCDIGVGVAGSAAVH
jgi:hypothetical protein